MNNLQKKRKQLGYTQKDIAELIGVSIDTIRRYEKSEKGFKSREYSSYLQLLNTIYTKINFSDYIQL